MIKIENTVEPSHNQWFAVIRGMRNPMNSWEKSDSYIGCKDKGISCERCMATGDWCHGEGAYPRFYIGAHDYDLMKRLRKGGPDDRKFMRMLTVYADITAPLYWWKEFDTYKVGTVANSCSTMHKIQAKEFTLDDFSHEHLKNTYLLEKIIDELNLCRYLYVNYDSRNDEIKASWSKKDLWWNMIQLLPSSYNQKRTVMLNYEVLVNMYNARKNHKLDEWHIFCDWIKKLDCSPLITGENLEEAAPEKILIQMWDW